MDEIPVTPNQLLEEIGRLTVANGVLRAQLVASRKEVIRLNQELAKALPAAEPAE